MFTGSRSYHLQFLFFFLIFSISGIMAIVLQAPWIFLIPFVWLLFPIVATYAIVRTEQLFWWLLMMLPLSTELNITPQWGLDFPDEILMVVLTGIVIIKSIHQPKWFPSSLLQHPLFLWLTIYFVWLIITCLFAVEPILSIKYLLAKIWFIIPFVVLPQIVLNSQSRIQKMALCLLIPMLGIIIQTLARHAFFGFSFENVWKTFQPFFRNHVNYSSMLVCLLPVAWCVWKLTPAANPYKKWILYGLLLGLIALIFAYSRGAWIALLAGIVAVWIIKKRRMGFVIVFLVSFVLISTTWLVTDKNYMRFAPDHDRTIFHPDFGEHMLATVALKDVSNAERFYRWIAGVRMFAEKPITGFGPNAFYLHYRAYTVSRFETWVSNNPEHSTVHNYFMLIALEQGLIGLLLFCILFFGMLLHIQRLYHQFQSQFYRMVTLTVGVVLMMIGVINCISDMIETDKIGSLFWLCLGMIVLLDSKSREEREALAR